MPKSVKAWWFCAERTLPHGDGRQIRVNRTNVHRKKKLIICLSGLHASRKIMDALVYAPGNLLCRVSCAGNILEREDKLVCSRRTYLAIVDASEMLHKFARLCALDVIGLWKAPEVVRRHLRSDNDDLRTEARLACNVVFGTAHCNVSGPAADAAREAIFNDSAIWCATFAARSAVKAACRATVKDVTRQRFRDAAWNVIETSVKARQNRRLTRMANELIRQSRKLTKKSDKP